ncbi:hypothetical protein PS2_035140 [Malus domestica]
MGWVSLRGKEETLYTKSKGSVKQYAGGGSKRSGDKEKGHQGGGSSRPGGAPKYHDNHESNVANSKKKNEDD